MSLREDVARETARRLIPDHNQAMSTILVKVADQVIGPEVQADIRARCARANLGSPHQEDADALIVACKKAVIHRLLWGDR